MGHKRPYNMAHTNCMLDKQDYMHTSACTRAHIQKCNIYCFSTGTMIRERACVTLYVHCLSCLLRNLELACHNQFKNLILSYVTVIALLTRVIHCAIV